MIRSFIVWGISLFIFLAPYHAFATTIIVDPGHGGHDPGAIGVNGLREKDVNLDIALKLKNELQERGFTVIMTRETDKFLTLQERVDYARASDGEFFVSIHANSHSDKSVNGSLVLYYDNRYRQSAYPPSREMAMLSDESYTLAATALDGLLEQAGTADRGVVPSSVFVIRNGRVPSILVETAFLSNRNDAALLASEAFRSTMAKGIADGIAGYKPPVFIDLAGHWAKGSVLRLEKLGVVQGNNHRYEPNREMTRAEYMTLLDQVFRFDDLLAQKPLETEGNSNEVQDTSEEQSTVEAQESGKTPMFSDLNESHWAYPQLTKAYQLGILSGYEDGTIRPNRPLTRAEMSAIFDRIAMQNVSADASASPFEDVQENSWYASSVFKLAAQSIIKGKTETSFAPFSSVTRAEAATIIDRYLGSPLGEVIRSELEQDNNQL